MIDAQHMDVGSALGGVCSQVPERRLLTVLNLYPDFEV